MHLRAAALLLLCCALTLPGKAQEAAVEHRDGPYLIYEEQGLTAYWADTEARTGHQRPFSEALPAFTAFRPELVDPDRTFTLPEHFSFSGVENVVALSDMHGQYDVTRTLLLNQGIIDEDLRWIFGAGHLVIVGDIFDRGDRVTEILWLIHNLQIEAAAAGGRVHFLLGNHETMILEGDDRYINARYRTSTSLIQKFYKELYGPDTYLGRWLRSLPLVVRINETVYVHGGLSREMLKEVDDITKLNEIYHRYLIDTDIRDAKAESRRLSLLHGRQGPLWYRGYFSKTGVTAKDISYILNRIDAERIIVGHTSFQSIHGFFNNRVIAVDSSIKFGSLGEMLIVEDGKLYRGFLDGKRVRLIATVAR